MEVRLGQNQVKSRRARAAVARMCVDSSAIAIAFEGDLKAAETHLVMLPYAGSVPGMNEPRRLAAPKATSSRLGEMV